MLTFINGSSGSGKTTAIDALKLSFTENKSFQFLDLDDLRKPTDEPESWYLQQIECQLSDAMKKDSNVRFIVGGWFDMAEARGIGENLGLKVMSCLLDCKDELRLERIQRRFETGNWGLSPSTEGDIKSILQFATELRNSSNHDKVIDTSLLSSEEVKEVLLAWIKSE